MTGKIPVNVTQAQVEEMIPVEPESTQPKPEVVKEIVEAAGVSDKALDPALAEVLANMQGEIARLTKEIQEARSQQSKGDGIDDGPGGFPWQYYKRPDTTDPRHPSFAASGWVVIGPGGAAAGGRRDVGSYTLYTTRGFRPLMNYGVVDVPTGQTKPGHEYITMMRNGGIHEFPVSQILALKWHLEPPILGTIFPQYEAVKDKVLSFLCDECEFEIFFLPEDEQAPQGVFRHLRNGHEYTRQEATMAVRAQGITNVAPYAIRAAAADIQEPKDAMVNYPEVKKVDVEAGAVVD